MKQKPYMAEHQTSAAADLRTLLSLCSSLLLLRDFTAAKNYAHLAQRYFPTHPKFPQIVAVADVLLAADGNRPNWFSILQLETAHENQTLHAIRTQFKKLLLLLSPTKNDFPFSGDAFKLVCDAWSVLSDPQKRTQFQNEVRSTNEQKRRQLGGDSEGKKDNDEPKRSALGGDFEGKSNGERTFWTVCPYCCYLYQYEGVYEECCLRCQHCERVFHGVAVAPPQKGMLVEGKEEYYCGFVCFPVEYHLNSKLGEVKRKSDATDFLGEKKAKRVDGLENLNVVEISEESEDEQISSKKTNEKMQRSGVSSNGLRVKSVARNTTKLMGRGKRIGCMDTKPESGERAGRSSAEIESRDDCFNDISFNDLDLSVGVDELFA